MCVPEVFDELESLRVFLPELDVSVDAARHDEAAGSHHDLGHHVAVHEALLVPLTAKNKVQALFLYNVLPKLEGDKYSRMLCLSQIVWIVLANLDKTCVSWSALKKLKLKITGC